MLSCWNENAGDNIFSSKFVLILISKDLRPSFKQIFMKLRTIEQDIISKTNDQYLLIDLDEENTIDLSSNITLNGHSDIDRQRVRAKSQLPPNTFNNLNVGINANITPKSPKNAGTIFLNSNGIMHNNGKERKDNKYEEEFSGTGLSFPATKENKDDFPLLPHNNDNNNHINHNHNNINSWPLLQKMSSFPGIMVGNTKNIAVEEEF
jgi:hypothetical protein